MEKNELLPCPFCGSAGYVTKNPFTGHYSIKCKVCGAKMTGEKDIKIYSIAIYCVV